MTFKLTPVKGKDLIGRNELVREIVNTLCDKNARMGFALYGKRRIGKSSILLEVERLLRQKKQIIPVYFSFWDLVEESLEEFIEKLSLKIIEAYKDKLGIKYKIEELVKTPINFLIKLINNFKINLKIKEDIELLLTFKKEKEKNYDVLIENLFNLSERLAKETKTRCVLLLDEFPSIMNLRDGGRVGEPLVKKIRTIYERQNNVVICVSGSIRKTMRTVALSSGAAFYMQLIPKQIAPLKLEDIKKILEHNIADVKIHENALQYLYEISSGIPLYIQLIGKKLDKSKVIEKQEVEDIVSHLLREEANLFFIEIFRNLSPKEKSVLTVMAKEETTKIGSIADELNDKVQNISKAIFNLENISMIDKIKEGHYKISDNFFKLWLKEK